MAYPTGYYSPPPGVLGGSSGPFSPNYAMGPLSQLAYQMAGSPQSGPFADRGSPPAVAGMNAGATGPGTGGGAGGSALGILGSLAKNPSVVKSALGLLGGGLGAYGSGAAADAAVTGALGGVGAQTAGEAAAVQAANDAALGGAAGSAGAGTAASTAAGGSGAAAGSALGAAGAAAIPLALLAAMAFVPDSSELTPSKISQMESGITSATQANGPLGASFTLNPNGTINQGNYQTLADLMTLESENPTEFAKAGGTGPITQYLQSLGYSPINWNLLGPARLQPANPGRQV